MLSSKSPHIVKSKYILIGCYMCLVSVLETEEICHKRQPNNSLELKKKKKMEGGKG